MNDLTPYQSFELALNDESPKFAQMLPAHIPVERFKKAALIAVQNNQTLLNADATSLFNSLSRCASDGLLPDNREAAIVIYKTKQGNQFIQKAQYMPMIDGVLKRARQSGEIATITARAVYENDEFSYSIDENGEHLHFNPMLTGNRGDFSLAFAMAKLTSGDLIVEPMTKDDIERTRRASKSPDKGPWRDWYDRMACKSALHRLARRLPSSCEIAEMLSADREHYDFNQERDITPSKKHQVIAQAASEESDPITDTYQYYAEKIDESNHPGELQQSFGEGWKALKKLKADDNVTGNLKELYDERKAYFEQLEQA